MNYIPKINFNNLLTNGLKFSLDLAKKNLTKVVSDKAFKVVKSVIFRKARDQKSKNVLLKQGDTVTFVVTKTGLEINDDHNILVQELNGQPINRPNQTVCSHLKTSGNQEICSLCLKSQLKSKL